MLQPSARHPSWPPTRFHQARTRCIIAILAPTQQRLASSLAAARAILHATLLRPSLPPPSHSKIFGKPQYTYDNMAKSARASRIKKNNRALKHKVFGPVEAARNERLSAKLLELAQQPKPSKPEAMVDGRARDEHTMVRADESDAMETEAHVKVREGMCARSCLPVLSVPIPAWLVVGTVYATSPRGGKFSMQGCPT